MGKLHKVSILLIGLWLTGQNLFAGIIRVGTGSVRSIKEAVNKAHPQDTIFISDGPYREGNIIIQKPLTIIGEDYPTLDGENKYEILTIQCDNVTVKGLRLINTGVSNVNDLAAINVVNAKHVSILDNHIENAFFGIHLLNSSQGKIANNQLQSGSKEEYHIGNGIHLWKCESISIDHNTIKGHRDGIYFEFVTNSFITHNHSEGNLRYGLHFMFSHNDEYRNNTFVNNGAGVAVMYTKKVRMIGNTFKHNWGSSSYGLLLKEISDSYVTGNEFTQNSIAVLMEGSSRIDFNSNTFSSNGYAVRLQASCEGNTFTNNNFSSNTFDLVTNGSLVLNTINSNYWDKYDGYDLNHDGTGDIPYHPVSMYGMIVERMPSAVLLWRSFLVFLMDRAEKAMPAITPENLKDNSPAMKSYDLIQKH